MKAKWIFGALKVVGLVVTVVCWMWAQRQHSDLVLAILIWIEPLLAYLVTVIGRRVLNTNPTVRRAEEVTLFVHYGVGTVLGVGIFPGIQLVAARPGPRILLPQPIGTALVWIACIATSLTVLNLAIRGLGAPFAAKISSRLATDWMYAWTRNPMVLCTLLLLFSLGLRYQSLWFVVWVAVVIAPVWIYFVRRYEERELEIRFGTSYREYRDHTPFLWPRRPRERKQQAPRAA